MAAATIEDRLSELDRKLDFIVDEIAHLKRVRNSAEDLVADLTIVGKDSMKDAIETLGSTALRPEEILHLAKTVLIDARLLQVALEQLESAADFIQDALPLLHEMFGQAVAGCQAFEKKGYFRAAAAGAHVADSLIQAHSPEDWKQVEASVPQLVGFLRELTRPEVLQALEAIIHGFGRVQATMNVNKSWLQLGRDVNSVEARRGMAILVEFLKVVGSRSAIAPATSPSTPTTRR